MLVRNGFLALSFVAAFLFSLWARSPGRNAKGFERAIVQGISCPSCAQRISASLKNVQGIDSAIVDVRRGTVDVYGDLVALRDTSLTQAIHRAGYRTRSVEPAERR